MTSTRPPHRRRPSPDLLVVGGGIVGLSVALFAAREGLSVVLVDPRPFGSASTARSGALIRTHYGTAAEARLALQGLELFERFTEEIGGASPFTRTGFAYVPARDELEDGSFAERVAMLRAQGVETEILDAAQLAEVDPGLDISDVGVVAYEPRSGFGDAGLTTAGLAAAARRAGAELRLGVAATALIEVDGRVVGAQTTSGPVHAGSVCVCAGVRSRQLCASVGLDLALAPTVIALLTVPRAVSSHLSVIDAAGGIYFRADPPAGTIVGLRSFDDVLLEEPDDDPEPPDWSFMDKALPALGRRLPSARGATPVARRAGQLDMTPDGRPLLGPTEVEGLWLSCGWSGTGFKTGPSAGRQLARWLLSGEPPDPALVQLSPQRDQHAAAGPRSPH